MKGAVSSFGDFRCAHCRQLVSAEHVVSGVNNRNHCPYCLWSRHPDLFVAGDRLSACKGQMKVVGLTMKKSRNKYRLEAGGELMLIHECVECGAFPINRISADDDPESIWDVFHDSLLSDYRLRARCESDGIRLLQAEEAAGIARQLGLAIDVPELQFD